MENEDAIKDTKSTQDKIISVCFTIAIGGITFVVGFAVDKNPTYSLIPLGITLISWVFSIFSGLVFLVKRGNNSAQAQSGQEVPLHEDYYKAPKYLKLQLYLCCAGIVFLIIWVFWHLFS